MLRLDMCLLAIEPPRMPALVGGAQKTTLIDMSDQSRHIIRPVCVSWVA